LEPTLLSSTKTSITSLDWTLSEQHYAQLEDVSRIKMGLLHDFLYRPEARGFLFGGTQDLIRR
jgi:hypothetical protein